MIKAVNPDIKLPSLPIVVVHRSDGSGTTNIFTTYLSSVNEEWDKKVGHSTSVNCPVGIGGEGNPGVAWLVVNTKGAIGYVELAMAYGPVRNESGAFIWPTAEGFAKKLGKGIIDLNNTGASIMQAAADAGIKSFKLIVYDDLFIFSEGRAKVSYIIDTVLVIILSGIMVFWYKDIEYMRIVMVIALVKDCRAYCTSVGYNLSAIRRKIIKTNSITPKSTPKPWTLCPPVIIRPRSESTR